MQETRDEQTRDTREDLIDSLIALSLLTRRTARLLINQDRNIASNRQKGEPYYGSHEGTGCCAYRAVRTL